MNLIDLKDFCIARGLVTRKEPGSLEILCRKVLDRYLEKPDFIRRHNDWKLVISPRHYLIMLRSTFIARA